MKPGVELDLLVAEHVIGWQWQEIPRHIHIVGGDAMRGEKVLMPPNADFPPHEVGQGRLFYHAAVPTYSTGIKDSLDVMKHLGLNHDFLLEKPCDESSWFCQLTLEVFDDLGDAQYQRYSGEGETPQQAICLAALKAVGYDTTT